MDEAGFESGSSSAATVVQIPSTPYFCREQIRERQVCNSEGFERDERSAAQRAPLGVVQIPPTPHFCVEQHCETPVRISRGPTAAGARRDDCDGCGLPTPCARLERSVSRDATDSDPGPGPGPDPDLDQRPDNAEARAEPVDWTYVDWLDAAAVAAPVVTRRLLRVSGLDRLRPNARRFLERLAAVACWYVLLGDLGAAIGVGLFALETLRLVTTRRRS